MCIIYVNINFCKLIMNTPKYFARNIVWKSEITEHLVGLKFLRYVWTVNLTET